MDSWSFSIPASPLVDNYPWSNANTIVDVGGGHGPVSLSIAQKLPMPTFIVQDLPSVVADGTTKIPAEYHNRISFMPHDMFEVQPVKDADVFLFRSLFHDWPYKYCVKILQAFIPALKPGARIVINDACMPSPGTLPAGPDRTKRMWDLNMMLPFNARNREPHKWANFLRGQTGGSSFRAYPCLL